MPLIRNNRFFRSVDERFEGRGGKARSMEGDADHTRTFLVRVRLPGMSSLAVSLAPGLPRLGDVYITPFQYDLLALARTIEAKPLVEEDWVCWVVTVHYSRKMPPGGPSKDPDHPESEPADISWEYETHQESPLHDRNGVPFLNSAGLPYSPPATFEKAYPVLSISRNELVYNTILADRYCYALNNKRFLGYPRGCAQSLPPRAEQKYRGKFAYWRVHYKIRFRLTVDDDGGFIIPGTPGSPGVSAGNPQIIVQDGGVGGKAPVEGQQGFLDGALDTWQPRLLDQGLMERVPNEDEATKVAKPTLLRHCRGEDGRQVSNPVCLDGTGKMQKARTANGNIVAVYRVYDVYRYTDLTALLVRGVGLPIGARLAKADVKGVLGGLP